MKDNIESIIIKKDFLYDGSQLSTNWTSLQTENPNSIICFFGPCDVKKEFMVDLEDLKNNCLIRSDNMVHFIIKIKGFLFPHIIFTQRLFISIIKEVIFELLSINLKRVGDDLYLDGKKLNISVATTSTDKTYGLIHTAVNITSSGTPDDINTISLDEIDILPDLFRDKVLEKFKIEWNDIFYSSKKVKHV
ncbi:MAG: DUF366 family protein [Candidatus Aureabacteria bacterium]|nr:DUF366 family protein [Candidatus Auribacterota bacterium]